MTISAHLPRSKRRQPQILAVSALTYLSALYRTSVPMLASAPSRLEVAASHLLWAKGTSVENMFCPLLPLHYPVQP